MTDHLAFPNDARLMRLVFISSAITPQQAKLCAALNEGLLDAHFWFYEGAERTRGDFWRVESTSRCHVLPHSWILRGRYVNFGVWRRLSEVDPDVVMLGGFSIPANYLAYLWARLNRKRIVMFTERSRSAAGTLRKRGLIWRVLRWMYSGIDMVMVSAEDIVPQFRDEFAFGSKVVAGRYASDIDQYLSHPPRCARETYSLIFPNRLTKIYNPLLAIDIFAAFREKHGTGILLMNAKGELRSECEKKVAALNIESSVEFLDNISTWGQLSDIYKRCDLMILPAEFSNGNFTVIEAMASGMGIVVSNRVLGVGTLIVDGENGFRCEPTVSEFLERLERYIANPELLRRHGTLNRDLVQPLGVHGTALFLAASLKNAFGSGR